MTFHHPVMDEPDFAEVRKIALGAAKRWPGIQDAIQREGVDQYVVGLYLDGRVENDIDEDGEDIIRVNFPQSPDVGM